MGNNKIINTLVSSILGGLFIALGALSYTTVIAGNTDGLHKLLGALIFSAGLIMTIRMGAAIFTSAVLDIESVEGNMKPIKEVIPWWLLTIIGNIVGAALVVIFTINSLSSTVENTLITICEHKCSLDVIQLVALGFLCNILVCIGALCVRKKFAPCYPEVLVLFPVTVFVLCGFEHSVANMFFLPAGYLYGAGVSIFEIVRNLICVLIGNLYGGLTVAWYSIEKGKYEKGK